MNKIINTILFPFITLWICSSFASTEERVNVVVSYPYQKSIVKEIGKDIVNVISLSHGDEDPHFVVPRPSLIGMMRKADLLIINGASLEIGFLPPLLKQANNPKINPGAEFLIDLSDGIELIEKPLSVSRSGGDVHPEGNPHFYLSYKYFKEITEKIRDALIKVRPEKRDFFEENYNELMQRYEEKKKEWDKKISKIKGCNLIQYHRMFNYVAKNAGCRIIGEIEPKPGIPPTAKHIEELIKKTKEENVYKIITDNYHEIRSVKRVSESLNVPYVILPHDVNSIKEVNDIFSLYDSIITRITE